MKLLNFIELGDDIMNLLITDVDLDINLIESENSRYIDISKLKIANCLGCFNCWTRTPGKCIIRDDAVRVYPLIAKSKNLIYVTKIKFGTYDTPLKTLLERSLPIQQAFIRLYHGEAHHVQRDVELKNATIIVYGNISEEENNKYQNLLTESAKEMALLQEIKENLPKDMESEDEILIKIKESENKITMLEVNSKKALDVYTRMQNIVAENKEALLQKNNLLVKWNSILSEKDFEFKLAIEKSCFIDSNYYNKSKISEEELKIIEKEIQEFYQRLKSKKDQYLMLQEELKDKEHIDIDLIIKSLNEKENELRELNSKEKKIFSRLTSNKDTLKLIIKISDKIKEDESEYNVIGELSELANGNNLERITFERYVLAAYFDDIIKAANRRLSKMTNERYALKRKAEKGKGTKQSGLELEIIDAYTGKERHVNTLSGGEGFKASLALALGLADVIQSYAGGVHIETMFVDEGFGSLDPESLDGAINALMDLKNLGRLVGIISHVDELRERIEARLEVSLGKSGSRAKFIMK